MPDTFDDFLKKATGSADTQSRAAQIKTWIEVAKTADPDMDNAGVAAYIAGRLVESALESLLNGIHPMIP